MTQASSDPESIKSEWELSPVVYDHVPPQSAPLHLSGTGLLCAPSFRIPWEDPAGQGAQPAAFWEWREDMRPTSGCNTAGDVSMWKPLEHPCLVALADNYPSHSDVCPDPELSTVSLAFEAGSFQAP